MCVFVCIMTWASSYKKNHKKTLPILHRRDCYIEGEANFNSIEHINVFMDYLYK